MIPKTMKSFMARLFEATNNGELKWKEGAEQAYFAAQKDANFHIRYLIDQDTGESGYTFQISRGEGEAFFAVQGGEEEYAFMRNLFSAISVNAAGGSDFVDDLFD